MTLKELYLYLLELLLQPEAGLEVAVLLVIGGEVAPEVQVKVLEDERWLLHPKCVAVLVAFGVSVFRFWSLAL